MNLYVLNDDKVLMILVNNKWNILHDYKILSFSKSDLSKIDGTANSYYSKKEIDIKKIDINNTNIDKIKWFKVSSIIKKSKEVNSIFNIDETIYKELHGLNKIILDIDNLKYENILYNSGISLIAGVDEVGRGPLYGPVVTACVILPKGYKLEGLTDSKKLTPSQRDVFYDIINHDAIDISIGVKSSQRIDEINIYEATKEAMYEAIDNLKVKPEHILIDAMKLDKLDIPSTSIIKGDAKSQTIAAASVIAKVTRDRMMDKDDILYPNYGFGKHKGYATKAHVDSILKYGVLKDHRKSFEPIKSILDGSDKIGRKEKENKD